MRVSSAGKQRKVATNLSLPRHLVERARALQLNLSDLTEAALEEAIRQTEREAWREENREAIAAYNAQVEARGVFSDGRRRF